MAAVWQGGVYGLVNAISAKQFFFFFFKACFDGFDESTQQIYCSSHIGRWWADPTSQGF